MSRAQKWYVIQERKNTHGEWEPYEAEEHSSESVARRHWGFQRAVFGQTPGCRFVLSAEKPSGMEWSNNG